MKKSSGLVLICLCLSLLAAGQDTGGFYPEPDTVLEVDLEYVPKIKSRLFAGRPGKAALYSLILPGAGQAYNKKYWQVPLVWAGVGTVGYFMIDNSGTYKELHDVYYERLKAAQEMREPIQPPKYINYSDDQIRNERDRWNRYRQMSIFGFALTWIANSAQAYVGAHLKDFDISDDLSIGVLPSTEYEVTSSSPAFSTGIVLKF